MHKVYHNVVKLVGKKNKKEVVGDLHVRLTSEGMILDFWPEVKVGETVYAPFTQAVDLETLIDWTK